MAETRVTRKDYDRLKARIRGMTQKAKEGAKLTTQSAMTIAGGATAGVLSAKYPEIGDTGVPTSGALGALLVAASVTGMLDDQGDYMAAFGSGLLAAVAATETEKMLAAKAAA